MLPQPAQSYCHQTVRSIFNVVVPQAQAQRARHQIRAQNLTDRYKRLEKSLQGKGRLSEEINDPSDSTSTRQSDAKDIVFKGFRIPKEPKPPADDECCMSNCAVCVYDLYDDSLTQYRRAVAALRASFSSLSIPESEWPASVQLNSTSKGSAASSRQEVVLSAFEEMERALKRKKEYESTSHFITNHPAKLCTVKNQLQVMTWRHRLGEIYEGFQWIFFSQR